MKKSTFKKVAILSTTIGPLKAYYRAIMEPIPEDMEGSLIFAVSSKFPGMPFPVGNLESASGDAIILRSPVTDQTLEIPKNSIIAWGPFWMLRADLGNKELQALPERWSDNFSEEGIPLTMPPGIN